MLDQVITMMDITMAREFGHGGRCLVTPNKMKIRDPLDEEG